MKKYRITNQRDLRREFYQLCDECGIDYTGKKHKYDATIDTAFNDWKDSLEKDGEISPALCWRATRY